MIHALKAERQYFEDVVSGAKPFEVRKNDRDFKIGDFLALNEISDDFQYTGRCCLVEVTYILDDTRFAKEGFVTLGIRPCVIGTTETSMSYMSSRNLLAVEVYRRNTMNTNIVQALRVEAMFQRNRFSRDIIATEMEQAADEIERLQKELDERDEGIKRLSATFEEFGKEAQRAIEINEALHRELDAAKSDLLCRCTPKAAENFKCGMYAGIVICAVSEWRGRESEGT